MLSIKCEIVLRGVGGGAVEGYWMVVCTRVDVKCVELWCFDHAECAVAMWVE